VFLVAAPVAAVALLVVLFLREVPLRGPAAPQGAPRRTVIGGNRLASRT
jgi:hypothetical protein